MSSRDQTDASPMEGDKTDAKGGDQTGALPPLPSASGGFGDKLGDKFQNIMTFEEFTADEYKMDHLNRGLAIVINNEVFSKELGLGARTGTYQDAVALNERFEDMGFDVQMHENVPVKEMVQILTKAAKDHNYNMNSDCFVCAILTHGEEGYVFGVDAKIETKQLLEPFKGNNCGSLVGKPKIFIIQACQGSQFDEGVAVDVADAKAKPAREVQVYKIPSEADFLIAYSVVPGYFSWRNSTNGSWFIQALSRVLGLHWQDMDLLTIMTRVNKIVAYEFESRTTKEYMNQKKQIPCITSMLTKEVRFKPKKK
ncbi:caspase-3-like [Dreissena polymorpha]|uniref:Caspase-3 n=1 Tax=Dreissena polymorpha TaxID=45954 RepID=A0A9D4LRI7_DREPO|nr:caspase-3-like [Dreissena polymorpha]KAH3863378.1 hypothetical protein DPMN_026363 [Dreissena polymorpha]